MRIKQYLINTDYGLWQIIMNGDEHVQTTKDDNGVETEVPPKTAQAILARQKERKAKSILLMAIPDEYQLRFHTIKDAKSLWAAIKKGLDKAYDRNKAGIDDLDIDDLYNNLKVFEADIKGNVSTNKSREQECDAGVYEQDNTRSTIEFIIAQDEPTELRLSSLQSDTEVQTLPQKTYVKNKYEKLQKQFDEQRQTLSKANLEIVAYQLGLEFVEAQLIVHQKNKAVYEEKITVLEFEVKDKSNVVIRLTNQLEQALKEKEDLKAKLEQFETSSKNLNKLINSQISSKHKTGLGYGDQLNENDSSGLDDSVYRPTTNKTSASVSQVKTSITPPSNTSVEMLRVESVRPSRVIIEDWISDDDEDIFQVSKVKVNTVKVNGVNTARQIAVSIVKGNGVTAGNPQQALKYKGMFDSGCSRHMTGNKALLTDYQDIDGGFVAFSGSTRGGKVIEPASEYDQALKNVLDKMIDQEKEDTEQSDAVRKEFEAQCDSQLLQEKITRASSTNSFNSFCNGIFGNAYDDHDLEILNTPYADQSVGAEADFNNMEPSTVVSPIPTTRVHSTHPKAQRRTNHKDFQNCLFACFLSQHEPTKISQALDDESWVEAMQEELLQFKIQKIYVDNGESKRGRDTKIPQSGGPSIKVGDEAVHKELGDRMERAATTASSLEVEQDIDLYTSLSKKVGALENEQQQTKKTYSTAITKLIFRMNKLEKQVKTSKARRRVRLVLSEDEDAAEDSSKQGRKISEIDTDPSISLVQDEEPSWFQEDAEIM
ncbi:hypothetical protein Tco_1547433 [Tanacetum coccineum]